jgi:hypothetical protein
MLAEDLCDYLFARSTGHIGSLMTLVNRGCQAPQRFQQILIIKGGNPG